MESNLTYSVKKPDIPKSGFRDVLVLLVVFLSVFLFSFFSLYVSPVEEGIYFGGYIRGISLCLILASALFYVKDEKKATGSLTVFYALCAVAVILPYFYADTNQLFALPLFYYLVGALCVTKADSLEVKRDSYHYLIEEVSDILFVPLRKVFLPLSSIRKNVRIKRNKKLSGAFFGVVLSLPVIAVLFGLLISGDAAFNNATVELFDEIISAALKLLDDGDFVYHVFNAVPAFFMTVIFAPLAFSALFCFRHGIQKEFKAAAPIKRKSTNRPLSENVAVGFFLAVCALYVLYLMTQLSYFFGAFSGEIPLAVNMSLSEYARRGFFEMSAIAVINLSLVALGVIMVKRKEDGKIPSLFKCIYSFLCIFTMLLVITAMSKMCLYITELGLTHKRILVCVIDFLIMATILCVFVKLHKEKFPYMKIIVSLCCAVLSLYTLFGDSALIASFNTNAYLKDYHTEIDMETISYETDKYHAVKNLHKIAQTDDEQISLSAKYWIGMLAVYADYNIGVKLEMSRAENFLTCDSITDFLFWEYVRDNGEFVTECEKIYCEYDYDPYIDYYHKELA